MKEPRHWRTASGRVLAALLLCCAGCRFHHGHYAMLADFPIQAVDLDEEQRAAAVEVRGRSLRDVVLFWPTGEHPTIDDALQDALSRTDADALIDVTVEREVFWIPFVYGRSGYHIQGKAVRVLHGPKRPRTRRSRLLQGR